MRNLFNRVGDVVIKMMLAALALVLIGLMIGNQPGDGAQYLYISAFIIFVVAVLVSFFGGKDK